MREILFRAFIKHLGWIVQVENICWVCQTVEVDLTNGNGDTTEYDFNEVELMQYTGLQDKKGVRIFEGDIVVDKQEHRIANADPEYAALIDDDIGDIYSQVVFCEGAFMLLEPGHAPEVFLAGTEQDVEVVGNVFENAELLEVE